VKHKIGSDTEPCPAAVMVKGEHCPCDEGLGHTGWPHGNTEHQLVWRGVANEAEFLVH